MSVATIKTFRSCAEASEFLAGKESVRIAYYTTLERINANCVGIKYHGTYIVRFDVDGSVTFDTGGWDTMTTFGRMHQIAILFGYRIGRKNWESVLTPVGGGDPITGWETVRINPDRTATVIR